MSSVRVPEQLEELRSKRRQILDAAHTIFSRKGYHRTTIDEIIALADTGKGTVYNYFVNKEQLFFTLTRELSQPFEQEIQEVVTCEDEPLNKLRRLVKSFLMFYTQNGDLWRVLMHEMRGFGSDGYSHMSAEVRLEYQEFFQRTIGAFERVLLEGIASGVIRKCDAKITAHGLFSVIVMMAFQGFVGVDVDDAAERVTDTFFYGIATGK